MLNILTSQEESKNDDGYYLYEQQHMDLMFSPSNQFGVGVRGGAGGGGGAGYHKGGQDKSRGGNALQHHQTANYIIGHMSEGGGSASSFSGSGQKNNQMGGLGMKSLKSSHTIEKTYSDFFNLTQEESANQLLIVSGISNQQPYLKTSLSNQHFMHPHQQSSAASLVLSSLTTSNNVPLRVMKDSVERKYGEIGQEIIEELYI